MTVFDTLLKRNNGKIFVLVYRKPTHTDQYLHYSSHHQISYPQSFVSSLFNRAYSIIINKDDLTKENAKIKQVLQKNGYQEGITREIFKKITNNHCLFHSKQQAKSLDLPKAEIRMSVNLPYVEGASEKLQRMLRSHKIRSTFYNESILHKLLCKPKNRVATEGKNNIAHENNCSNCESVVFEKSERSFRSHSDRHKRFVKNCKPEKYDLVKHCWEADHNVSKDQKKVDRESRLIPTKVKETIHFLKTPNQINKIFYMLPEICFPNSR